MTCEEVIEFEQRPLDTRYFQPHSDLDEDNPSIEIGGINPLLLKLVASLLEEDQEEVDTLSMISLICYSCRNSQVRNNDFAHTVAAFGLFNVCAEHFPLLVTGYLHYLTTHMMKRFDPNNNWKILWVKSNFHYQVCFGNVPQLLYPTIHGYQWVILFPMVQWVIMVTSRWSGWWLVQEKAGFELILFPIVQSWSLVK